jgi:hypothetical protein
MRLAVFKGPNRVGVSLSPVSETLCRLLANWSYEVIIIIIIIIIMDLYLHSSYDFML